MFATITWSIGIFSLAGHKEWRFIHPILPLLHVFAAKSLVDTSSNLKNKKKSKTKQKVQSSSFFYQICRNLPPITTGFTIFLLLTVPASIYVVLFYCSAPISVLLYVRSLPAKELQRGTIGFLMPCHSTPGHAYIHREGLAHGKMWALGCEPPLEYVLFLCPFSTVFSWCVSCFQKSKFDHISWSDQCLFPCASWLFAQILPFSCEPFIPSFLFPSLNPGGTSE